MSIQDILIGVAVGVVANFLTPVVRNWAINATISCVAKAKQASIKILEIRLNQLKSEREYIEKLVKEPLILTNAVANCAIPQVFSLWVIVIFIIVYAINNNWIFNFTNTPWSGAIFGLLGYATRFPLAMIIVIGDLQKLNELEVFLKNNTIAQGLIESRIKGNVNT